MARLGATGRAAAAYLVLAGFQRGISLLILPFISHAMAPSEYGAAAVLTASSLLLVALVAAPLEQLVFRVSARGGEDAPALIRAAGLYCFAVLPFVAGLLALTVALAVHEFLGVSGTVWAIEIVAVGLQPATTYFALPFVRARQELRKFVWIASASVIATAGSKLVLVVGMGLGVMGWAISDLLSAALTAVLTMILIHLPRCRVTSAHIRMMLRFCIPLIPHRAAFWALLSLSRPAMATVSSLAQVGLLSFGLNLASVAGLIIGEFQQAVLPRYSRENFPAPTEQTRGPVRWQLSMAISVPAVVGAVLAVAGPWIFAQDYWQSFALTGILLCGQVAFGLYLIPMNYIVQAAGLPRFSALASVSGAAVIMIGIFAFGNRFGALGVAYATAIGFVLMAAVAFALARALKLRIQWRSWLRCWPEAALGLVGLVCSIVALSLTPQSVMSVVFAVVCLPFVGASVWITARHGSPIVGGTGATTD